MYEIIIIGAGPAGLSAAITARARGKKVLVVSNDPMDSPLAWSSNVDNYPGLASISGKDLLEKMVSQAQDLGVGFNYSRVITILPMGRQFSITTGSDVIDTLTVIMAPGAATRGKQYPGEQEYLGRGVSYCATCDGMLYRNSTVCIIGMMQEAIEEANFMKGIGSKVHYIAPEAPEGLVEGIEFISGNVEAIEGDALGVTSVRIKEKTNSNKTSNQLLQSRTIEIHCSGVFILRPSIAPDALISGLEISDGFISVDRGMRTNIPGVFAAGDCTGKPLQIAKAVGDGQIACLSAVEYLDKDLKAGVD